MLAQHQILQSPGDRSFPVRPLKDLQKAPLCLDPLHVVQGLLAALSHPEFWSVKRAAQREGGEGGGRAQRAREEGEEQREEKNSMRERQIENNCSIVNNS